MSQYIIRRMLLAVPVLIGVTMIVFFLTTVLPGDPARIVAGRLATKEQVEAVRIRLGLDKPLPMQYGIYLSSVVRGNLGNSMVSKQPVVGELRIFFPATLELSLFAMSLAIIIGIPIGMIAGSGRSPWINSFTMLSSYIGVGLPLFWAGLIFQVIFGSKLGWFPISGRLSSLILLPPKVTGFYTVDAILAGQWVTFADALFHLILPGVTLSLALMAELATITKSSMKNVMRQDFIRTAKAKGLGDRVILCRHALRNAILPTTTIIGLQVGFLLGGALLVEEIFTWGGIGTYAWRGIFKLDTPVIMGITLTTTVIFMFVNLLTDVLYTFIDPRITYN